MTDWQRDGFYEWRWRDDGAEEWRHVNDEPFGIIPVATIMAWHPGERFDGVRWISAPSK